MLSKLFRDWENQTVVIVASGSSAPDAIDDLKGYPTVAVNLSFRLVPDADMLYAADTGFWNVYGNEIKNLKSVFVSPLMQSRRIFPQLMVCSLGRKNGTYIHKMLPGPIGNIGCGGNSGFQAINLVAQYRPKQILLAGFDYCGNHWHEDHCNRLRNPTDKNLRTWSQRLDSQADVLQSWGIDVVNLSANSSLRGYRREKSFTFNKEHAAL